MEFRYGLDYLTPSIALDIASDKCKGIICQQVREKIEVCFKATQEIAHSEKPVYAINTGFGSLCNVKVPLKDRGKLQENLLLSHSVGVGNPLTPQIVKLMLILKVHALAQGYSGISIEVVERIIWHIEQNLLPRVPEQGSVGASGDLCPLSHCFLPLINYGELTLDFGVTYHPSAEILEKFDKKRLHLQAKEGLALNNGTQFMAAHGIMIHEKMKSCLSYANLTAALSLEGYLGSNKPFFEKLNALRPHPGAISVSKKILQLMANSDISKSHENCGRVQDPYSMRCIPQVHGASYDAWKHFEDVLLREINSVTDNPIIFGVDETISGGLFHGQPIALPMDYVGLAASELGNISDRRTYLLIHGHFGLPAFLIEDSGVNSGFMITQYCTAALASENKSLCFPASADSIPTSMGQEDHVSMGSISGRKTLRIIENVEKILAIELLCACQALDFRRPLKSSEVLEKVHAAVRKEIPHILHDEAMYPLIDKAVEMVRNKTLLPIIE